MSRYKVFLLYVLLLLPCVVSAEVRSVNEARELAYDFMESRMKTKSSSINLSMVYSGEDIMTKSSLDPAYYVFNNESGPGFVVISGDDSALPVLGFSDSQNFKKDGMPANLRWWFRYMGRQVNAAREAGLPAADRRADVGTDVIKYETALWDQGEPYNNQCPKDGRERSVTGCGPTAIAIAMRWREWPAAGTGTIPAYEVPVYNSDYTDITGYKDFPGRTLGDPYDWDNMPLSDGYYGNWTSAQEDQVARLMADIGAATYADYSAEGTGIWDEDVPPAMKAYFGYDQSMDVKFRQNWDTGKDQYTKSQWYKMVKDELENGPAIYAGADYEGSMGHMFILAGYTTNDYYYLNWGWGGIANGYYTLEALTPDEQGYGANELGSYHDWVSLMVNFKKDSSFEPEPVYNLKENASLSYDHNIRTLRVTVTDGVKVSCINESGKNASVANRGSNVYEINVKGLTGVYDVILSKDGCQEVVQIILGE